MEQLDQRELETRWGLVEQLLSFPLGEDSTKMVQIGTLLMEEERNRLLGFLRANFDAFAWMTLDMSRIPSDDYS